MHGKKEAKKYCVAEMELCIMAIGSCLVSNDESLVN